MQWRMLSKEPLQLAFFHFVDTELPAVLSDVVIFRRGNDYLVALL